MSPEEPDEKRDSPTQLESVHGLPEHFDDMARRAGLLTNDLFVNAYKRFILSRKYTTAADLSVDGHSGDSRRFSLLILDKTGRAYRKAVGYIGDILKSPSVRISLSTILEIYAFDGQKPSSGRVLPHFWELVDLYEREPNLCESTLTVRHLQSLVRTLEFQKRQPSIVLHPLYERRYSSSTTLSDIIENLTANYGHAAETMPLRIKLLDHPDIPEEDLPPLFDFDADDVDKGRPSSGSSSDVSLDTGPTPAAVISNAANDLNDEHHHFSANLAKRRRARASDI